MDNALVYARFDIVCLLVMMIITLETVKLRSKLPLQNLYLRLMVFAVMLVTSDMMYELVSGGAVPGGVGGLYIFNGIYFVASTMIGYTWFVYTQAIVKMSFYDIVPVKIAIAIPALASCMASIFSYRTKWIFYFDENGLYCRGEYNWVSMVIPAAYFAFAILCSIITFCRKKTEKNKRVMASVAVFVLFPLLSIGLQAVFVGVPIVCIGSMLGMLWVFINNITAEREAIVAENMVADAKSQFFASMSHEIRTPINAVLGMNTMILRESTEPQVIGYARVVESSGKMLLSTVNDILDFSKAESGKLVLVCNEYETADLVRDLMHMIKNRADDKGLKFVAELEEIIPSKLYGDDVRIRQVITNLLTNAVKYTDRGTVTLRMHYRNVDEKHIRLQVAVADTGRGIKPENMDSLFSPYARMDENKNRKVEGTGLGMSIVKTLLDLMNSELKVESVYGEGSTFSFEIIQEVRDRQPMGSFEKIMSEESASASIVTKQFVAPNAKILTVDDTVVNLVVFKELLKKTRMKIDTATSGEEAIAKIKAATYDIIFLDHMMPGMDGIECLKIIREQALVSKDTPIIVLTANVISGYREMFLEAGFTNFLAKPIDVKELDRLLREYLPKEMINEIGE